MSMQPKVLAPPESCDCHFHVFGPSDKYPYAEPRSYTPGDASIEEYLELLERLFIQKCILVQPSVYGIDNRLLLDTMDKLKDKARAVAVVDESVSDEELTQMHEKGVRGIRFNLLFAGGVEISSVQSLAERIKEFGWHVQLLLDAKDLPELNVHLRSISTPLVFDHMGHISTDNGIYHPGFKNLLSMLSEGNCWVKLSGPYRMSKSKAPFEDVNAFARELVKTAPDRCVWGSDWPHPAPPAPPPAVDELLFLLYNWCADKSLAEKILCKNPKELYWS